MADLLFLYALQVSAGHFRFCVTAVIVFLEAADDVCWRVGLTKLLSPIYKLEKKVNVIFKHVSSLQFLQF